LMHKDKLIFALLMLILIAGLVLAHILYSSPFYSFDDSSYITFAHQIIEGNFNPASTPRAYGFFLPLSIALSFSIFGTSILASILPAVMEYLIIIALTFVIARKLYGNGAGLISAFLIATAPFVVGYSTRVLPDMGVGLFAGLSILFFVYAQDSSNSKLLYFLSGAFAVLIIYVKMIGLAYVLFFFVILLFHRPKHKLKTDRNTKIYAFAGMFLFAMAYAYTIFFYSSGNLFTPFFAYGQNQITISHSGLSNNINSLSITLFGYSYWYNQFFYPFSDPQTIPLGLIILLAIIGSAMAIWRRERNLVYFSVLLWGVLFYLFFGTVTITKYSFIFVVSRYFILVSVPMAVLAGYAVWSFYKAARPHLGSWAICPVILILAASLVVNMPAYSTLYNYNLSIAGDTRTLLGILRYVISNSKDSGSGIRIYTNDNDTEFFLQFLSAYNKTINISSLDVRNLNEMDLQLYKVCKANYSNTYILLTYENYFGEVSPNCDIKSIGVFYDNISSGGIYSGTDLRVYLYRVN
jgi:4-amino-4-deoxy-L-arabinose transferase-like glycosyltransferase